MLIAAFFRFYQLSAFPPGLYPDEAMNGNNALEVLHGATEPKVFYPENNGREGLFINIQAYFLNFFMRETGNIEPWMLRVPSALFGVLTVLGVYFLTRELLRFSKKQTHPWIPLFAAFFTATSFWHINFSRIGFRAIMAPFFLTWGLFFILMALRKMSAETKKQPVRLLPFFAGLVYGLGFHSYIAYRATPLLLFAVAAYILFKKYPWRIFLKFLTWFSLGFVLALTPLLIFFAEYPQDFLGRTSQISIFSSPTPVIDLAKNIGITLGSFNVYGDGNWRHNIAGRPLLFFPVGVFFLLGIVLAVRCVSKKWRERNEFEFPLFISVSWLIVAALPVVVSNEGLPHALRSILMIPAVMILAAIGSVWLYEHIKKVLSQFAYGTVLLRVGTMVLFVVLILEPFRSYFITWGKNPNTADAFIQSDVKLADELNILPRETQKYIIVEAKGTDVRGLPMPTQTVMFLTDTFLPSEQATKNIHYVLPQDKDKVPPGSFVRVLK